MSGLPLLSYPVVDYYPPGTPADVLLPNLREVFLLM